MSVFQVGRLVKSGAGGSMESRSGGQFFRQQPAIFLLDHRITFAGALIESGPVEHQNTATRIADQTGFLQTERAFGLAFAAHTKHVGNEFLRHHQFIALQAVQAEQQPPAQLLVQRVVAVAHGRLGHLRNQGLGVAQQQVQQGRP